MIHAGETLLHFRFLEPLGSGGGGTVWRALDTRLDREVALKLLPEAIARDAEALARLEREARVLASLDHPNIVTVFSVEGAGAERVISMELVRGATLGTLIPEDGLRLGPLLDLAVPLADALSAAHERGIVHRDLKPGNVLVASDGRPKILDFGLASRTVEPVTSESPTRSIDASGDLLGTIPYMSPEQARGRTADPRSDVFSFGVMLYEMATGRRPFPGGTAAESIAALLRDDPPPPSSLKPEIPVEFDRIVGRCLEKDPRRRFQTSLDLRNELEDLRRRAGPATEEAEASVAVLPFVDMSREKDQEYFCDGVAEEIVAALTRIRGLRVASRTSSFIYRASGLDSREIARRLGVRALLDGSVRKADDKLRVTAELVDAATGWHLWSETYDRELRDVFAIQEEIARSIAAALKVTLTPSERRAIGRAPTRDLEAYEFWMRGRKFLAQFRRRGYEFAIEMFQRAIEIDPSYARAWAGLAEARCHLYLYVERAAAHRDAALEAARRALDLDPALAEAHVAHGIALSASGRAPEAERAFEEAMRQNPRLYDAPYRYARHCFAAGELEKAVRLYEEAAALRPDDHQAPLLVAQIYQDLGRHREAQASYRRGLRAAEERLRLNPDDVRARYMGANALVVLGERERGMRWADAACALDPDEPMLLYNVGCIRSLAGDANGALDALERAATLGLTEKGWYEHDSNLDPLRKHPRFAALLRRIDAGRVS